MSAENIQYDLYALAALFIHANNMKVTKEGIEALFSLLNLEYSSKLAQMFELDLLKISDLLSSVGNSPPSVSAPAPLQAETVVDAKQEESEEDVELDFGSLFD